MPTPTLDEHIQVLTAQRAYFASGATRAYAFRARQLTRLRAAIEAHESQIFAALAADMRKPPFEGYTGEIGFIYAEISHALKHLKRWMRPERVTTPLALMPSTSYVQLEPKGIVLIIAPWNYPVMLLLAPLIGAIAAGNCAILKPSELAPHTAQVMAAIVEESFAPHYVTLLQGDAQVSQSLLTHRFDHLFFTGSTAVGRIVARAAAEHLTPATLELGGKSPCIIDRDVDLGLAARRVAWGKFFNAGQTCVAPDYLLVDEAVKPRFVERLVAAVHAFFGDDPAASPDFARIVNERHFDRLVRLLDRGEIIVGGQHDRASLYVAPTVIDRVNLSDPVMQEEIFGPVLPVLTYRSLDEALDIVRQMPNPLALYVFSTNRGVQERVTTELSFGGGCINHTLVHLANSNLPFGGVGGSGMGNYHGQYSFKTFSHAKAIVKSAPLIDPSIPYPPHKEKLRIVRRLLK